MVAESSARALVSWLSKNALEFKKDRSEVRDSKSINKTTDEWCVVFDMDSRYIT